MLWAMRALFVAIASLALLAGCAPPEWRVVCHVAPPACSQGGTIGGLDAPVPACVTFDAYGNLANVSTASFTCAPEAGLASAEPTCAGENEVPSCVQLAP